MSAGEPVTLDEAVEAIAQRVIELQREHRAAEIVDAKTLAGMLKVSVDAVYASKEELGAIRLGKPGSKRAVYRFDVSRALKPSAAAPAPTRPPARRPRAGEPADVELLPIKGQRGVADP